MALGHFVLGVAHHRGAVDIGGNFPAEGTVEQVVFGSGGEVLAAPDHMGDAHEMVVDDIGKVVGGEAVTLEKHLIIQSAVFHGDVAENGVVEGGGALCGDLLPNNIGQALGQLLGYLLRRQAPAGVGGAAEVAAVLLGLGLLAEAVVGGAFFHQLEPVSVRSTSTDRAPPKVKIVVPSME